MSVPDELEQLGRLRRDGVLTEEEFAAAKQRLLAGDTTVQQRSTVRPAPHWVDGRLPLAAGSAVMLLSLFMPWVDVVFFRLNAIELVRVIFGAGDVLRELTGVVGAQPDSITRAETGVLLLVVAATASMTAPLWTAPAIRNRLAVAGSGLVVAAYAYGAVQYAVNDFLAAGASVFLLGAVSHVAIAGLVLLKGDLSILAPGRSGSSDTDGPPASSGSLFSRIVTAIGDHPMLWVVLVAGTLFLAFLTLTEAVPNVIDQEESSAVTALSDAGFTVASSVRLDVEAPEGQVVEQSPSAGMRASRGSSVEIVVAQTPRFTLNGQFDLRRDIVGPDDNCTGSGPTGYWRGGVLVMVYDENNDFLGSDFFSIGQRSVFGDSCVFEFEVRDIKQSSSYIIDLGIQDFRYTHEYMVASNWSLRWELS